MGKVQEMFDEIDREVRIATALEMSLLVIAALALRRAVGPENLGLLFVASVAAGWCITAATARPFLAFGMWIARRVHP